MLKETVIAQLETLSQNLCGYAAKNYEKPQNSSLSLAENLTARLPNRARRRNV